MEYSKKSMKIIFVTQEDPFYIKIFFETFLANYKNIAEIDGVVICRTMGKSLGRLIKQMYNFYGPVDFVRMGIRYMRAKFSGDLKRLFRAYNIAVIPCDNINDNDFIERLRLKNIDLLISVAAPQIFKEKILNLPRLGCINIHNARLPKYRGMLPNFWNMYHDEKSSAITIHTMDKDIDRGKIILQREFEIKPEESLDSLIKRTKALGALYMIEAIEMIRKGNVKYLQVDNTSSSYYSFPTREDVRVFRSRGKRIL